MLYKFKNGVAEKWTDGTPIVPMDEVVDLNVVMKAAGYVEYMDADDFGVNSFFSIMVYKTESYPARWIVLVFDYDRCVDEYHTDNSFDLATLVNTFCAPLGIMRKIEGE